MSAALQLIVLYAVATGPGDPARARPDFGEAIVSPRLRAKVIDVQPADGR